MLYAGVFCGENERVRIISSPLPTTMQTTAFTVKKLKFGKSFVKCLAISGHYMIQYNISKENLQNTVQNQNK